MDTKVCKLCEKQLPLTEFYMTKRKEGMKPVTRCKKCYNVGAYQKRPTGFAKLPKETQEAVREQLADRRVKVAQVALDFGIPKTSLQRWLKRGDLNLPVTADSDLDSE